MKQDALGYLREENTQNHILKHSTFSTSFSFNQHEDEVPFLEEEHKPDPEPEKTEVAAKMTVKDETVVENAMEKKEEKGGAVPTKRVTVDEWVQLNSQAPPQNW